MPTVDAWYAECPFKDKKEESRALEKLLPMWHQKTNKENTLLDF